MDKMMNYASCLIKAREHYIGFPPLFSHYPQGMTKNELVQLHELVLAAMDEPRVIPESSGKVRRMVVGTGNYLVMGLAGYVRNLVPEVDGGVKYNDQAGRVSLGFVGLVWNLKECPAEEIPSGFPAREAFAGLLQEHIIGHWMDSQYSKWAEQIQKGIEVPYRYEVPLATFEGNLPEVELNRNKSKVSVYDRRFADALICKAITEAGKKEQVSFCTDLWYYEEEGSCFLNLTTEVKGNGHAVNPNPLYIPKPPKQPVVPVVQEETGNKKETDQKQTAKQSTSKQENDVDTGKSESSKRPLNFGKAQKENSVCLKITLDSDINNPVPQILNDYLRLLSTRVDNDCQQKAGRHFQVDFFDKYTLESCTRLVRQGTWRKIDTKKYTRKFELPEEYTADDFFEQCYSLLRYFVDGKEKEPKLYDMQSNYWFKTENGYYGLFDVDIPMLNKKSESKAKAKPQQEKEPSKAKKQEEKNQEVQPQEPETVIPLTPEELLRRSQEITRNKPQNKPDKDIFDF